MNDTNRRCETVLKSNCARVCVLSSLVALSYDAALSSLAYARGQPTPQILAMGLLGLYAMIGFVSVRVLRWRGALIASAAAGATVGTVGLMIAVVVGIQRELMLLDPVAEVVTSVVFGLIGALARQGLEQVVPARRGR